MKPIFSLISERRYSEIKTMAGTWWLKATAAWQLWNYAAQRAHSQGKPLLRINLDETRIP